MSPELLADLRRQREDPRYSFGGAHGHSHNPAATIHDLRERARRRKTRQGLRLLVSRMLVQ